MGLTLWASELALSVARSCMIGQTLKAKCVKTCDSLWFVVDIETNRASEMLLEVFQKGLHRDASLSWLSVVRKLFHIPRNQN